MGDLPGVLGRAGGLLLRHWPALLTLGLLGSALRAGALWGAYEVGAHHYRLAQVPLALAPIGVLLPVIGMFEVCRRSMPRLDELSRVRARDTPTERRPERLVDVAASILIPFMAVYESYGLLEADLLRYRNDSSFDELFGVNDGTRTLHASARDGIYSLPVAVAIIVVAWLLRWSIGLAERASGLLMLAYVGALADVVYTGQLFAQSILLRVVGARWLEDRRALHWASSAYHWTAQELGFLSGPFRAGAELFGAIATSWNEIILVPIAWLGVGAVVLARKEADEEAEAEGDGETADPASSDRPWLLRAVLSLGADLRTRLSALFSALRLLGSAGLVPMLVISLVLLVVARIPALLAPLVHALVGPQKVDTFLTYSPYLDSFQLGLSLFLTVPLVASAVAWLTTSRLRREGLLADLDARTGASHEVAGQDTGTLSAT